MATKTRKESQSAVQCNRVWRHALLDIKASNPDGLLLASDVVEHARHPDHVLHGAFDWDDEVAAENWRLMQARTLIRAVIVTDDGGRKLPAFVSLEEDRQRDGGGYRQLEEIVTSQELLGQLERTAKKELQAWTERYKLLTSLVESVAEVAGIEKPKVRRRGK